ncbi:hypothetical protein [Nocardia sp. NPDC020380]|uniref:hypothetical protein n=1 Tax=Nocardia sp. NPDC020380 TaxID=3364309 RepID=UPI0037AFA860
MRRGWAGVVPAVYSFVLALIVVGPLLGRGYLLLRDAVSTPRSYLTDSALGLGDAAPRAVPQDALIAVLSPIIDGGVLVKVILVGAVWLAGWGAAVLVREMLGVSLGPQLVAATVGIWNPYVGERLLQGHWSLLTGYAALPWIAVVANRLRLDSRSWASWAMLAGWLAAAGLTPTGSLLAGCVALVLASRRSVLGTAAFWIAASAPWLAATVLSGAGAEPSDPAGVAAFAARAEPWLGTLGSLAGLGGIWNGTAVPDSRTTPFALLGTVLLLALVATGVRTAVSRTSPDVSRMPSADAAATRTRRILLGLAVIAVLLPALGATGWGLSVGEFLVSKAPGAGLLRDTQKYVALTMPAYALCAAAGCRALAGWFASVQSRGSASKTQDGVARARAGMPRTGAVAALFIVLTALSLPDLAWGVGGALRPVHYPASWGRVAAAVNEPGDVAVLPGGMFRKFRYSGSAPVLDPAPRMLPNDVLQTGELPVHGAVVAGEGVRATRVEQLLLHGGSAGELGRLGVGWVLVERDTPGPVGDSKTTLEQLDSVYADDHLQLYRVPGPITEHAASSGVRRAAGAAHLLWAGLLCAGTAISLWGSRWRIRSRSRTRSQSRSPE